LLVYSLMAMSSKPSLLTSPAQLTLKPVSELLSCVPSTRMMPEAGSSRLAEFVPFGMT